MATIEESKDLFKIFLTELMGPLQAHEERMHSFSKPPLEQALQAKLKLSNNGENKKENSHDRNFPQ